MSGLSMNLFIIRSMFFYYYNFSDLCIAAAAGRSRELIGVINNALAGYSKKMRCVGIINPYRTWLSNAFEHIIMPCVFCSPSVQPCNFSDFDFFMCPSFRMAVALTQVWCNRLRGWNRILIGQLDRHKWYARSSISSPSASFTSFSKTNNISSACCQAVFSRAVCCHALLLCCCTSTFCYML